MVYNKYGVRRPSFKPVLRLKKERNCHICEGTHDLELFSVQELMPNNVFVLFKCSSDGASAILSCHRVSFVIARGAVRSNFPAVKMQGVVHDIYGIYIYLSKSILDDCILVNTSAAERRARHMERSTSCLAPPGAARPQPISADMVEIVSIFCRDRTSHNPCFGLWRSLGVASSSSYALLLSCCVLSRKNSRSGPVHDDNRRHVDIFFLQQTSSKQDIQMSSSGGSSQHSGAGHYHYST